MAEKTAIEWTHHTFNPWRGCTKVSAGCAHCYADAMSKRNPGVFGIWGDQGTRVIASESAWREPLKWDRAATQAGERRRVFCASMADVFEDRPELIEPRVRLFHLINQTPGLDWLLLTKRPENIQRFHGGDGVRRSWAENMPPNVWLGVSVENQEAIGRLSHLAGIAATVKFVSAEPLLGPLVLRGSSGGKEYNWLDPKNERGIHWVIIGGESGHHARPCEIAWIRSLVEQCRAANVACFVKQDSGRYPGQQGRIPDDLWQVPRAGVVQPPLPIREVSFRWIGGRMTVEYTDDNEEITAEWLSSIRVYPGDNNGSLRSQEHEVRINAGNAVGRSVIWGDEPGESIYLGISLTDGLCYVKACDEQNNTVSLVELGIRRTRGEFRQLLRALQAWDAETCRIAELPQEEETR